MDTNFDVRINTNIFMRLARTLKWLPSAVCWLCLISVCETSSATGCHLNWAHPVSQHIEMRGMSFSLDEYANNERHFSIRQANHSLDIYFLQEALLIKGPPMPEIEEYSEQALSWFPMAFAIPDSVLSESAAKDPCSIKNKTRFSRHLTGALGFGPHKLTFVEGEIMPTGSSSLAYTFAATVTPPLEGVTSIAYSGSMRFARRAKPLANSTKVTGYTLVGVERPFPVVGDRTMHFSTVGELRAMLARRELMEQDDDNDANEPGF